MGVSRVERKDPQGFKIGILQDAGDEPFSQTAATEFRKNKDVGEIGVGGEIGDDPGQSQLGRFVAGGIVNGVAERIGDRYG